MPGPTGWLAASRLHTRTRMPGSPAEYPRRRSPRLRGYDYAQIGAYFVTACTHDGSHVFGNVSDGAMQLSNAGRIVHAAWMGIQAHFSDVELDAFVVMPNHVHGIVLIDEKKMDCAIADREQRRPLDVIIGSFKSAATKRINEWRRTPAASVWQRSYYDHIIRDDETLEKVREYIEGNPGRWWERRAGMPRPYKTDGGQAFDNGPYSFIDWQARRVQASCRGRACPARSAGHTDGRGMPRPYKD